MTCPVLTALAAAVAAIESLPVLTGLGADIVLDEQLPVLAGALARLQRQLAVRMAAAERATAGASDVRGDAVRAGLDPRRAGLLRRAGMFTDTHGDLATAWRTGQVRLEQIELLRVGSTKVRTQQRRRLITEVLPLLPGLDERATRQLIDVAVDHLNPGDPDHDEQAEHAARRLAWTQIPHGGLAFEGYLPTAEAAAFTAAITTLAESMRVTGDALTMAQRRADGLTALIAAATEHGLPTAGGLPAVMNLTVSLTEATRIADRNPAQFGTRITLRPRGSATLDSEPAGDATIRFGLCCAAITPILTDHTEADTKAAPRRPAGGGHGSADTPLQGAVVDLRETRIPAPADRPPEDAPPAQGRPEQPLPPRRPAHAPGSLLDKIAATPVQPLAVGRSVRLATTAQRHALRLRDGGCVIHGCDIDPAHTQPHHVTSWALGGTTDLNQLVSLCWVHHRLTELGRFTVTPRTEGQPRPPGSLEHPHWWILPPIKGTP